MVEIKKYTANRSNYGLSRKTSSIKYICVHATSNDGDSDEGNSKYFKNNIVKASAHYFVDDDSITQSVPDNYIAYSVGGSKYNNCSTTGGGKYYNKCTNSNSISIELCDVNKNGKVYPSNKTISNALDLVVKLMKKYNIPKSNVIRHFDVTGKACPVYWCGNSTKNKLWQTEFYNKIKTSTSSKTTTKTTTSSKTTKISTKKQNIISFQTWLNKNFKTGLKVDGIYGNNTKKAVIKAWQSSCNKLYKTSLKVDGVFGDKSKTASKKVIVKDGSNNRMVYILQGMLNCNGYVCGFDGKCGTNTITQLKKYQKAKKLTVDGKCGANTWIKLFS